MEVSVENQEGIGRKVTVSVDADIFENAIKSQFARYSKNAKIPGFRQGKVPEKMLEQQFGGSALKDAVDKLINEYYPKALQQEKITPASLLNIMPTQVERGKAFVFDVEIEVYPEIDSPTLAGESIETVAVAVEEADIERTLENIQKRQTEYNEVDRASAEGDQLIIDFTGTIDGEPFAGGEGTEVDMVLGEGRFMPEFESNLTGVKKGDTQSFEVPFPEDYHGKEVAGKTAKFEVSIKQVNEGTLPEINDDFAKTMGVEDGVVAMRGEVRIGLEREMHQKLRTHTRNQVFSAITAKYDFPIPKAPVEEEIDRAVAEVTRQLEQQGMMDKSMIKREAYEAPSKERVKLGLLVRAVVEAEKFEPNQELIEARVNEMAESYSEPDQYKQYILNDEQQRNQVVGAVLEEQVIEHLLSTATVKEVKQDYEAFMTSQ